MRRGDVVVVAGGPYTSRPRPVILIQDPALASGDSVFVVPLTTQSNDAVTLRVAIKPTPGNGLDRSCFAEVDKVSAIQRAAVDRRIGAMEATTIDNIEIGLKALVGFA
jgi:mRNA interferase MazF